MLRSRLLLTAAAFAFTCVRPATAQPVPGVQPAPSATPSSTLQEVIVTAQRREQNLQQVPVAVTAITGQALQDVRFADVRDLNAIAPGLTVRESAGGAALPQLTMRGVYGVAPFGADSGVATYVDGVYLPSGTGAAFDLADVERIEVLRGPQGTLFGRNAIGGAVNLITKTPAKTFQLHQEFTGGNLGQFRTKTRIDTPAWGPLSAALTYLHSQRDGDVKNLGAGTTWNYRSATQGRFGSFTSPSRLGGENINAVSAAVQYDPGGGIQAIYHYDWTENHFVPRAAGYSLIGSPIVDAELAFQPNPGQLTPLSSKRPDAVNNWFSTDAVLRTQNHSFTVTVPIADGLKVKDIAAYHTNYLVSNNQLDGLGGLVNVIPQLGPVGQPFFILVDGTFANQRNWSNEFQVIGESRWASVTAGYLHYESQDTQGALAGAPQTPTLSTIPNFTFPFSGATPSSVKTVSDAFYIQAEFHATDRLDVVLGGRSTKDRKTGADNSAVGALLVGSVVPGGASLIDYRGQKPTYLVGANYKISRDLFAYAKYNTGYISGGQLDNVRFNPETAKSWEMGLKSDLFDRRLRLNVALYDAKYSQIFVLLSPQNPACQAVGASLAGSQCLLNGGDARAKGFEVEATAIPVDGLTLSANTAYTDFKYTQITPGVGTLGAFFPEYTPKWTANLAAQYDGPEVYRGGHVMARVNAAFASSQFGFPNGDPATLAAGTVPSTWILNGRVGLAEMDLGGAKAQVALWAKNLLDNRSIDYSANLVLVTIVNYQPARTLGVDVNFAF